MLRFARNDYIFDTCLFLKHPHITYNMLCRKNNMQTCLVDADNKSEHLIYEYFLRSRSCKDVINESTSLSDFISSDVITALKNNKNLLILSDAQEYHRMCDRDLVQLSKICSASNVDVSRVLVICNGCSSEPQFYNIVGINYCLFNYFESAVKYTVNMKRISYSASQRNLNIIDRKLTKKFLCLNRQPRDFRYDFVFNMWKRGLLTDTLTSLPTFDSNSLQVTSTHIVRNLISNDFSTFCQTLPLNADEIDFNVNQWDNYTYDLSTISGINIITETIVDADNTLENSTHFFTEKIFKSIIYGMPFLVVGRPGFLSCLKKCGYKTFSSLWDESYDNIIDWNTRREAIIEVMKYINSLSIDNFYRLLERSLIITNYNFLHMCKNNSDFKLVKFIQDQYYNL